MMDSSKDLIHSVELADKQKIIALINALLPEAKIYLFGSRSTTMFARTSDIDIALDTGEKIDIVQLGELRDVLNETNIVNKIDLVDCNAVPESMRQQITKHGIVWKA